nr:pyruvate kinase [Gammaproteobacteria bacterium]
MVNFEVFEDSGRKTKVVCTIGPATASEAQLRLLIEAGMDVARLNFAHGSHREHGAVIERIRRISLALGRPTAILQDLAGPKVRIGAFANGPIELEPGRRFTLTAREVDGDEREVSVSYPLAQEVNPGDTLLLADGSIQLEVSTVTGQDVHCEVVYGGRLSSHKGVNCPSGLFGIPILRDKDKQDLRFGVDQGVDYMALSFVRTAADVRTAKQELGAHAGRIPVIAKIETQAALQHIDEILAEADGLMIARGDLSIETPFTAVPILQKQLVALSNRSAKPVITATQMLFSMVSSPSPTRAEVADVANAILDGSDAVMLSEETAVGAYPIQAVRTMIAIAQDTERAGIRLVHRDVNEAGDDGEAPTEKEALARAACRLARSLRVDVIGIATLTGESARFAAKYRPSQPILAATPVLEVYRRLALVHGVTPLLLPGEAQTTQAMISAGAALALQRGWRGKKGVFLAGNSLWLGVLDNSFASGEVIIAIDRNGRVTAGE